MSPDGSNTELPLFLHWEKFLLWLLPKTGKFSRSVRFTLQQRIDNHALDVLEGILAARYRRDRGRYLNAVSLGIDSSFRLPTAAREMAPRLSEADCDDALPVVCDVLQAEHDDRHDRRVQRLRKASRLPGSKTFATLDHERLPLTLRCQLRELAGGTFLDQAANVLAFGLPGTGKSHAAWSGIGSRDFLHQFLRM